MRHSIVILVALALAVPALAEHHEVLAGIEAANAELTAAVRAGDVAGVADCYTEDA
jgi:hypothetical protein